MRQMSMREPSPIPSSADRSCSWESAFETFYVDLCEYVLRLVGSAEVAEDIVQDLFLYLWDTRRPRDDVRLTGPYLYVAARHRALKHLRHRHVVSEWMKRARREEPRGTDTPEDVYAGRELRAAIDQAVDALPARCREIFLLRRRDQLSYQAIAKRLGVSLGTVKSQIWRATVLLKENLAFILPADSGVLDQKPRCATRLLSLTSSASSRATARPTKRLPFKPGSAPIPSGALSSNKLKSSGA